MVIHHKVFARLQSPTASLRETPSERLVVGAVMRPELVDGSGDRLPPRGSPLALVEHDPEHRVVAGTAEPELQRRFTRETPDVGDR